MLVKIGGAQLEQPTAQRALCEALRAAHRQGHELIVVHGGGNQIRTLCRQLGLDERYHQGLRVTDARTAEVVLMVLAGLVNRTLVAELERAGVPAAGLSGADGGTFSASRLVRDGVDLGFVGSVEHVRPRLVEALLASGHVPVIATVAPQTGAPRSAAAAGEPFLNVNADHAAGPLCRAFGCEALLFLTDVEGVRGEGGQRLASLTPADCERLVANGTASGGMLPKLEAALAALRDNPAALVKIAPAGAPDAVLAALRSDTGTRFVAARDALEAHLG